MTGMTMWRKLNKTRRMATMNNGTLLLLDFLNNQWTATAFLPNAQTMSQTFNSRNDADNWLLQQYYQWS